MAWRGFLPIIFTFWFVSQSFAQEDKSELIQSDISSRNIAIESNFTGERIVIFGTIENSQHSEFEKALYDVVVAIRGPKDTVVIRKKSRIAGIWINADSYTFANVPGYYAVLSTRPLGEVANRTVLNAYGLGFDSLILRPLGPNAPATAANGSINIFRSAVVRIRQKDGLFSYKPEGVVFVGRNLFRATIDMPANVPVGQYATDVYLLRNGEVLSHNRSQLKIHKEGFERFVFSAAFDHPLLYGIAAVIIAISAGLLASVMTRRD
ncbi:MAG: TIGR02186 family protein [Hyphomicrobiaceae bacterium]|nr:TIGR02186 family protein [Hyphomicrobiaceae bacterium]